MRRTIIGKDIGHRTELDKDIKKRQSKLQIKKGVENGKARDKQDFFREIKDFSRVEKSVEIV